MKRLYNIISGMKHLIFIIILYIINIFDFYFKIGKWGCGGISRGQIYIYVYIYYTYIPV